MAGDARETERRQAGGDGAAGRQPGASRRRTTAEPDGVRRPVLPRQVPVERQEQFDRLDDRITRFFATWGILFLRVSVGVVFFWFGFLKFFPGLSPAETLAGDTIQVMTGGLLDRRTALIILAAWESAIGLGLIFGKFLRATLLLLFLQMPGTVMPMFFFPELTFHQFPVSLTLEGQYIVKNLVLISAGIVIGGTVRGGWLSPHPGLNGYGTPATPPAPPPSATGQRDEAG